MAIRGTHPTQGVYPLAKRPSNDLSEDLSEVGGPNTSITAHPDDIINVWVWLGLTNLISPLYKETWGYHNCLFNIKVFLIFFAALSSNIAAHSLGFLREPVDMYTYIIY